ncbi:MAG: hypothetical protein HNEKOMLI_00901 [Sodalis sp. Psp]|nr:hypothetical protein [Sodalis sp. Psp]MCR3757360.1 hypothetical protein [Sodalis sp. Ppy]
MLCSIMLLNDARDAVIITNTQSFSWGTYHLTERQIQPFVSLARVTGRYYFGYFFPKPLTKLSTR